jgi:hypothetical protein
VSDNGQLGNIANTADASAHSAVDAFTQSIVLGANIQTNTFSLTVVGHDVTSADHGGTIGDASTHTH